MNAHVRSPATLNLRTHSLIAFVLQPVEPLSEWLGTLDGWLAQAPNFFANKPIILDLAQIDISVKDYRDLLGQLARRHIRVMGAEGANPSLVGPHLPPKVTGGVPVAPQETPAETPAETNAAPAEPAKAPPSAKTLVIDAPVRSGQSIVNLEGDITIVGRVASGAEIIAGGSVHVYGAIQGRVIAGVSGAPNARIFCTEARAELLCIGGAYRTAEDMDPRLEGKSVEVRLAEGGLQIRILN
ncbi:septum site-determining protein MinC [Rhodoblastus acidophilus]|uniref:Probable septum site-determining protein MinC n=1 Tax=Candidatus Rhodoblastus alkanivorans TaxID=2954117 RepID=A0ABS9Z8D4_9HYPH|nr:septum site-determining protein MinC [Candidatus Rhodoblastus alkanivorans]MCI4679489.1 septum site-determining protein MinC [Candidatus Rhodoblastus alkanivorans]MCI4683934.1 septum site-determining protein MinC [Candidatus Rhodoblastus alkanivorans]MDI4641253.1 septum site-determining protein MinC [Rhodoblastus acidophilus]